MKKPTVLCVGTHESLQVARTLVLRQAGYAAESAYNRHIAVLAASERHFDVAVICTLMRNDEREQVIHDLQIVSPETAVVPLPLSDLDESPELLLALVRAALERKDAFHAPKARRTSTH